MRAMPNAKKRVIFPRNARPIGLVALLALAIVSPAHASGPDADLDALFRAGLARFDEATRLKEEKPTAREEARRLYRDAALRFEEAWQGGATSTEVLTNAANARWFAGDVGEAVLFYRRALAVDPTNSRARDALASIRATLPISKPTSGAASLADSLFFWHDERYFLARFWTFAVLFPLAWLLLAVEVLRSRWPRARWLLVLAFPIVPVAWALAYLFGFKRPYAVTAVLCLFPALAALASLAVEARDDPLRRDAVVLVEVRGRNGDGDAYQPSHSSPFPPGTEVEIRERRGAGSAVWLDVRLRDGSSSWIPSSAVETIVAD